MSVESRAVSRSSRGFLLLSVLLLIGCGVRGLIYPAPQVPVGDPPPSVQRVSLPIGDGSSTFAWFKRGNSLQPLMLFFHGNGENLETLRESAALQLLEWLDVDWLAVEYPGYGGADGFPSENSLTAAALSALDFAQSQEGNRPIIVAGWSLGAAVAMQLAAARPQSLAGLIVMSPWTSLPDIAREHYPSWLVGIALRERWDSLAAAESVTVPSLVMHGARDNLIPSQQGRTLAGALPGSIWLEVPSAGHNDLLGYPELWDRTASFLLQFRPPEPVR